MNKKIIVWGLFLLCGMPQFHTANAGKGGNMLSDEIKAALTSESYIYVATRRANGEWSAAAPIWFMYDGEAIYFTAAPSSHKAHRIHRGSPVRIWVGRKDGPVFEGEARLVKDRETVERMGEAYSKKNTQQGQISFQHSSFSKSLMQSLLVSPTVPANPRSLISYDISDSPEL